MKARYFTGLPLASPVYKMTFIFSLVGEGGGQSNTYKVNVRKFLPPGCHKNGQPLTLSWFNMRYLPMLQGRNQVYFFIADPNFYLQILTPDPKM